MSIRSTFGRIIRAPFAAIAESLRARNERAAAKLQSYMAMPFEDVVARLQAHAVAELPKQLDVISIGPLGDVHRTKVPAAALSVYGNHVHDDVELGPEDADRF